MKQLAIIALLLLGGCNPSISGGKIIGKCTKRNHSSDRVMFMLELESNGTKDFIEVSEEAWNQAAKGIEWPFQVK